MDIYFCDKCSGRPYTKKLSNGTECPVCGNMLKYEDVSEESLSHRPEFVFKKKHNELKDIIKPELRQNDEVFQSHFIVNDGEIFYEYLGFEKTGSLDFTVRFILGNQADENAVINKTPLVSPKIKFAHYIELTELELMRKSFEKAFSAYGFEKDNRLFHAFVKRGDEEIGKKITEETEEILTADDIYADRYFISYDYQGFGDIALHPFRKDAGILDEVKRVLGSRYEKFMEYMIFRARNGDNMKLDSFADDSAVLFDNPHIKLIRYDRLLKEASATRM